MVQSIPVGDLESHPSAKFENIGDRHVGRILDMDERNQTDPKTGEPKVFPDGSPRKLWAISIEKSDGEIVVLYAAGGKYKPAEGEGDSMLTAIGLAVRAAGAAAVDVGGELAVVHSGLGERKPGMNAPRLYKAEYRPPKQSIPATDLFGDQA